jgi:hypothetical protein
MPNAVLHSVTSFIWLILMSNLTLQYNVLVTSKHSLYSKSENVIVILCSYMSGKFVLNTEWLDDFKPISIRSNLTREWMYIACFVSMLPCHCEVPIHGPAIPTNLLKKKIDDFRN